MERFGRPSRRWHPKCEQTMTRLVTSPLMAEMATRSATNDRERGWFASKADSRSDDEDETLARRSTDRSRSSLVRLRASDFAAAAPQFSGTTLFDSAGKSEASLKHRRVCYESAGISIELPTSMLAHREHPVPQKLTTISTRNKPATLDTRRLDRHGLASQQKEPDRSDSRSQRSF